jgi:hypothetical protein
MKKSTENQISIYKVMNVLDSVLKREQFINTFEVSGTENSGLQYAFFSGRVRENKAYP